MTTQDGDTKNVCHSCIGDQFLADEVKERVTPALCSYCGETREAIPLDALAGRIDDVFREHFRLTPGYPVEPYEFFLADEGEWCRRGDEASVVIADIAELDEGVAGDLTSLLSGRHSYRDWKEEEEEENPYGPEAMYEERKPFDLAFRLTWSKFCREIRSRSRFLSAVAVEMLSDIFGDLTAQKTYGIRSVILQISPGDQDSVFWRERTALSSQELEVILKSPVQEQGPRHHSRPRLGE